MTKQPIIKQITCARNNNQDSEDCFGKTRVFGLSDDNRVYVWLTQQKEWGIYDESYRYEYEQ